MTSELVVLMTASSEQEARVIEAALRASGIPAVVEGGSLMDEWAVTQRAIGGVGAEVKVPASMLDEAKVALQELRKHGARTVSATPIATPVGELGQRPFFWPPSAILSVVVLGCVVVLVGLLWLDGRMKLNSLDSFKNFKITWEDGNQVLVHRWRDNGKLAARYFNSNFDKNYERVEGYDREGVLVSVATDADEDGVIESLKMYSPHGKLVSEWCDIDEDGFAELRYEVHADGRRVKWRDSDGDRLQETKSGVTQGLGIPGLDF